MQISFKKKLSKIKNSIFLSKSQISILIIKHQIDNNLTYNHSLIINNN